MELHPDNCYPALVSHDARFDGVFFVGVASTGIYCRTVCTAKTPLRKNCTFYPSAAAAERAGYRPCLRCRPELAPGNARIDAGSRLAAAVAGRIEDGALGDGGLTGLAAELGVSDRHLRRVVREEYGVSPVELAQTHRLLLAKRLLTDTALPVTEVALASGFASLRRFNALFLERYGLNPTAFRRGREPGEHPRALQFELAYRPPYDGDALLAYLAGRAAGGVESVEGGRYFRTAAVGKHRGWIAVAPDSKRPVLGVEISLSLLPVLSPVLARVKRQFDLAADPHLIAAQLGPLAAGREGLRVPGAFDGFETAVRAVLGQQVSVRAATTLMGRFVRAFGEPVETPVPGLTHLPPDPERVARSEPGELIALGILAGRAGAILALARAVAEGRITLEPRADIEETKARLRELPGIGEWTAEYVAMRSLSWPDAFPHTDLGVLKALGDPTPRRTLEISESWRPWRAYAVMHLWKSLEERR